MGEFIVIIQDPPEFITQGCLCSKTERKLVRSLTITTSCPFIGQVDLGPARTRFAVRAIESIPGGPQLRSECSRGGWAHFQRMPDKAKRLPITFFQHGCICPPATALRAIAVGNGGFAFGQRSEERR